VDHRSVVQNAPRVRRLPIDEHYLTALPRALDRRWQANTPSEYASALGDTEMDRRWAIILGSALVLSVGANVYLALSRDAPASAPAPSRMAACPPVPPTRVPVAVPRSKLSASSALGDCADVEQRLAEAEAEADKYLPPSVRFERSTRNEANETKIRPFLDKVFTDAGHGRGYEVECRAWICRLTIDHKVAREDWMETLQSEPSGVGLVTGRSFGQYVHLTLADQEPEPHDLLIGRLSASLMSLSAALETCKKTQRTPGDATFTISLDAAARRLVVKVSGSLAVSPLSDCIRPLLESAIAMNPVPAEVKEFPDAPITVTIR